MLTTLNVYAKSQIGHTGPAIKILTQEVKGKYHSVLTLTQNKHTQPIPTPYRKVHPSCCTYLYLHSVSYTLPLF